MKRYVFVLYLLLLYAGKVYSQPVLLSNGGFENTPCPGVNDLMVQVTCPTFSPGCLPSWQISHGSPTIISGSAYCENKHLGMAARNSIGEGVFHAFSFKSGVKYTVSLWVKSNQENGDFYIRTANGLTGITPTGCANALPAPSSHQNILVKSIAALNTTWSFETVQFTSNANYDYIQFFPHHTTLNAAAVLEIDNIFVYASCEDSVKLGPNAGGTARTIDPGNYFGEYFTVAGSSANGAAPGVNFVSTSHSGNVNLVSATKVTAKANFNAKGTATSTVRLYIGNCIESCSGISSKRQPDGSLETGADLEESVTLVSIYPNPVNSVLHIEVQDNSNISSYELMDVQGRIIASGILAGKNEIEVSTLTNGVYFIRFSGGGPQQVHKFIKY